VFVIFHDDVVVEPEPEPEVPPVTDETDEFVCEDDDQCL
jgi:hypothetical protein